LPVMLLSRALRAPTYRAASDLTVGAGRH
jgi:hypothetical protein